MLLVAYAVYRVLQFSKYRKYDVVPRVQVQELAARLKDQGPDQVVDRRCSQPWLL